MLLKHAIAIRFRDIIANSLYKPYPIGSLDVLIGAKWAFSANSIPFWTTQSNPVHNVTHRLQVMARWQRLKNNSMSLELVPGSAASFVLVSAKIRSMGSISACFFSLGRSKSAITEKDRVQQQGFQGETIM